MWEKIITWTVGLCMPLVEEDRWPWLRRSLWHAAAKIGKPQEYKGLIELPGGYNPNKDNALALLEHARKAASGTTDEAVFAACILKVKDGQ